MVEPPDTPRPRPPLTPGAPLPRISFQEPSTAEPGQGETAPSPAPAKRNKPSSSERKKTKPGEMQETPSLDTYEGRRAARIVIGTVAIVLVGLVGFFLYRTLSPGASPEALPDLDPMAQASPVDREQLEREATKMFQQARLVAQNGNPQGAVGLLKTLSKSYPQSAAAREAQAALDRPAQGLPMFVDGPAVVAKRADPPPSPTELPSAVVQAVAAGPTAPAQTPARSDVQLVLPAHPAEPRAPGSAGPAPGEVAPRALPSAFRARPEAGVHSSGWPLEIVGDRDGATMVLVPGGSAIIGRDDGSPGEGPAHPVLLSTYYIDQHEVTVGQFARFLHETARRAQTARAKAGDAATPDPAENMPVVRVSGHEARDYAQWAGKALPTEAQWEMAARTTDGRHFPWGGGPPPWDKPRAYKQLDPVMAFPADQSPYGVYDLAGNAWEWTADWFDPGYHNRARTAPVTNPTGPDHSRTRPPQLTIKGGSKTWHISWREGMKIDAQLPNLGFRCALSVEQGPSAGQVQGGQADPNHLSLPESKKALAPF